MRSSNKATWNQQFPKWRLIVFSRSIKPKCETLFLNNLYSLCKSHLLHSTPNNIYFFLSLPLYDSSLSLTHTLTYSLTHSLTHSADFFLFKSHLLLSTPNKYISSYLSHSMTPLLFLSLTHILTFSFPHSLSRFLYSNSTYSTPLLTIYIFLSLPLYDSSSLSLTHSLSHSLTHSADFFI